MKRILNLVSIKTLAILVIATTATIGSPVKAGPLMGYMCGIVGSAVTSCGFAGCSVSIPLSRVALNFSGTIYTLPRVIAMNVSTSCPMGTDACRREANQNKAFINSFQANYTGKMVCWLTSYDYSPQIVDYHNFFELH